MDEFVLKHLKDLYGLSPDAPHRAFQFPRLPPGIMHPMFKIHDNPSKERFHQNASNYSSKKLLKNEFHQNFTHSL